MSTEIPISIRIKAEIEGATEVADLVNNLEKLKSLTGSLGQTMKETGEKGQELTKGMEGVSKISPEAREAAHGLNELRDSAIESQEGMVKIGSVTMPLTEYMRRLKIETQEVGTETGKLQERLVNAAKSSGVYFEGLEDVSAAMRDQSALMGFRKQLLGSLITSDYNKAAATQYLTGELHGNAQAARILVDSYTTLQSAGFTLKSVFGSISQSLEIASKSGDAYVEVVNRLRPAFATLMAGVGATRSEINAFSAEMLKGADAGRTYLIKLYEQKKALGEVAQMQREYKAQLGATGVALQEFGRNIFWTGLGIMFTTMSIARSVRSLEQMQDISWNVAQATLGVEDAQRAYNKALEWGGPASEEAVQTKRRLIEAEYNETRVRRQARTSIQQYYLSLGMLVFGLLPTAMRTATTFGDLFAKLGIIHRWTGDQAVVAGGKELVLSGAQDKATASSIVQGAVTGTTGTIIHLTGDAAIVAAGELYALEAAEMGAAGGAATLKAVLGDVVGLIIFIGSVTGVWAYSNWQADKAMQDMERQIEETTNKLRGGSRAFSENYDWIDRYTHGSGIVEATEKTKEFASALDKVPTIERMTVTSEVEPVELEPIPEEVSQLIIQELTPVEIEEPSPVTQLIITKQELEEAQIPSIENLYQYIIQILKEVEIESPKDETQLINQELIEVDIPDIEDSDQYIYQHLIQDDIEVPEELTQVVRQEIVGQKLEERRRKLVLTGMDNIIIRNMQSDSLEGRDMDIETGISKWYKVGSLTADEVIGAFGPSAIEIELLRVMAQQSVLLDWLPHIWARTGNVFSQLHDEIYGTGSKIATKVEEHMKEVKGIGTESDTRMKDIQAGVSTADTDITGEMGTNTTTLSSPLGKLDDISEDAEFLGNLKEIAMLAGGIAGYLNIIAGAPAAVGNFFTNAFNTVGDTIGGGFKVLDGLLGILGEEHTIHVKLADPIILPDTPSQTINININNPVVTSEADIDSLAREVRYQIVRGTKVR